LVGFSSICVPSPLIILGLGKFAAGLTFWEFWFFSITCRFFPSLYPFRPKSSPSLPPGPAHAPLHPSFISWHFAFENITRKVCLLARTFLLSLGRPPDGCVPPDSSFGRVPVFAAEYDPETEVVGALNCFFFSSDFFFSTAHSDLPFRFLNSPLI